MAGPLIGNAGFIALEAQLASRDPAGSMSDPEREALLEGKRVVVVDDSLVRGTTSRKIVRMLRTSGAAEVHVRICSPPIQGSCFYGVDTPTQEELIAHRMSVDGIRDFGTSVADIDGRITAVHVDPLVAFSVCDAQSLSTDDD